MAKVDCSTLVGFVAAAVRLCEQYDSCVKCPFGDSESICPRDVFDRLDTIGSTISNLQKWSDEHPQKTRLDDLNEKYPNYRFYENDKCPDIRPAVFGYCDACAECRNKKQTLRYCWDEPLVGGATGKAVE